MTSKKNRGLSDELKKLRIQKRQCIKIIAIGVIAVLLLTIVRQVLGFTGVVPFGYAQADTIMYILCLGVCFIIGPRFSLYLRIKRQIQQIEEHLAS